MTRETEGAVAWGLLLAGIAAIVVAMGVIAWLDGLWPGMGPRYR